MLSEAMDELRAQHTESDKDKCHMIATSMQNVKKKKNDKNELVLQNKKTRLTTQKIT